MSNWRKKVEGMKVAHGDGPVPCDIMFIGEALGRQESSWSTCPHCNLEGDGEENDWTCYKCGGPMDCTPKPFVGASGHFLNRNLGRIGMDRSKVHINNIVPVRPPNNDLKRLGEIGLSLEDFEERTRELLELVQPKVIVPVGNVALNALTGLDKITKRRGSPLELKSELALLLPKAIVIPMIHPANIFRLPTKGKESYGVAASTFVRDLRKIKKFLDGTQGEIPKREFLLEPTLQEVKDFLASCADNGFVTFDTEMRKRQIACISIAKSNSEAICIPIWHGWDSYWPEEDEMVIWEELSKFFKSEVYKVAHNVNFDISMLAVHGLGIKNVVLDTAAVHRVLWPELPRNLAFLTSIYTLQPYYKDDHKDQETGSAGWLVPKDESALWHYCAMDSAVTYEIMEEELRQIAKYEKEDQVWPRAK